MKKENFGYSVVIITGGSSGIGASFLTYILNLEQKVLICNLSRRKPEIFDGRDNCYHFECDLTHRETITEVFSKISSLLAQKEITGKILLINNSGFGSYGEFQNCELPNQLKMIDLNVCSIVHLTGLMLPLIIKNGGAIINISSALAFQPSPFMATYGATKTFGLYWSLAIRDDLKQQGVKVLAVCPGPTRTNFFARANFDFKDSGDLAENVVKTAWQALEKDKGFVVVRFRYKLLVCMIKFLPLNFVAKITGIILRKMRV